MRLILSLHNVMQEYQSKVITLRSHQVINNHCFLLALLLNEQGGMTTKEKEKLLGNLWRETE